MDDDNFLLECPTYKDYLDTLVTKADFGFLRNSELARSLATLGYRSANEVYSPHEFEIRKAAAYEAIFPAKKASVLFGTYIRGKDPVLKALAARELLNAHKMIATILFVRDTSKPGYETSAYIDYEESLRKANSHQPGTTDWCRVFAGYKKLVPQRTDLSFFDWHTGKVLSKDSYNWTVIDKHQDGIMFRHTGDHKIVSTDTNGEKYKQNCIRSTHYSDKYGMVVFYDHTVLKKA